MDPFYRQDIFFFVTTVAVIVLTAVLTVATVYIIKILNDVKHISRKAKIETDHLAADIEDLRSNVRREGFKVKHAFGFFNNFMKRHKK